MVELYLLNEGMSRIRSLVVDDNNGHFSGLFIRSFAMILVHATSDEQWEVGALRTTRADATHASSRFPMLDPCSQISITVHESKRVA